MPLGVITGASVPESSRVITGSICTWEHVVEQLVHLSGNTVCFSGNTIALASTIGFFGMYLFSLIRA